MGDEAGTRAEFHAFFERHHRELSRFAYLLTGDRDVAEDIAADAFVAAWRRWDRVRSADMPVAYMRRTVANLATSRVRRIIRERRCLGVLRSDDERTDGPDVPAVMDVRAALAALPARKRACVVMRFALDISEEDTAEALGVSVGTVKSQTSKGVAELGRLLRPAVTDDGGVAVPALLPGQAQGSGGGSASRRPRRTARSRVRAPRPVGGEAG